MFLQRLKSDWDRQKPTMRTCWNVKDALTLHAVTGAFLFLRKSLQAKVPQSDFNACIADIDTQFSKGFLDPELEQLLSTQVPPSNLSEISFMRILGHRQSTIGGRSFSFEL